jgi:hypothetical protein
MRKRSHQFALIPVSNQLDALEDHVDIMGFTGPVLRSIRNFARIKVFDDQLS